MQKATFMKTTDNIIDNFGNCANIPCHKCVLAYGKHKKWIENIIENPNLSINYHKLTYLRWWKRIMEKPKHCTWTWDDASENLWETSCAQLHEFIEDGPKENNYKFCPYCGKVIKVMG